MSTDAKRKANSKYRDSAIIKQQLDLNKNTDQDIIRYLNSTGNKMGAIKKAIRSQMNSSPVKKGSALSKKNHNKSTTTKKTTTKTNKKKR